MFEAPFEVGTFVINTWVGTVFGDPEVTVATGPVVLQNIALVLDPIAGSYSGTGDLYVGFAVVGSLEKATESRVEADGVIPVGEVPVPVDAEAEIGFRTIWRLGGEAGFREKVAASYSGGTFALNADSTLQLGGFLQEDHEAFLRIAIETAEICNLIWPHGSSRIAEGGLQISRPLTISNGAKGWDVSLGSLKASTIPVGDIKTDLEGDHGAQHCMDLTELAAFLCEKGMLPADACRTLCAGGVLRASECAVLFGPSPPGPPAPTPITPPGPLPPGPITPTPPAPPPDKPIVYIDPARFPESAKHASDAIASGREEEVTIDRPGAGSRRSSSVGAYKAAHDCDGANYRKPPCTLAGQNYDEYPQALFKENGGTADVRPISGSDNMGSGASIGNQCRPLTDGKQVRIVIAVPP